MATSLMLDQWVTESLCRHTIARGLFFSKSFSKKYLGGKKSKDDCSKTIKPISKFLSHIKCTWIKLRIHNTFTKFSWGFQLNATSKMSDTTMQKIENVICKTSDSFCLIASHNAILLSQCCLKYHVGVPPPPRVIDLCQNITQLFTQLFDFLF